MSRPYPVIEQRSLEPVPGRRLFGPKRTRTSAEIPQSQANQRLVYRINGDYLLDNSTMPLNSHDVLEASHVSLVDLSPNTEVMVELEIPSKDAGAFTLRATFLCAVTDAVVLVREGPHDVGAALRGYLRSHHRIFELGLDHPLAEINDVRRKINAQVKAYDTICPPVLRGVTVELASVEVLTPDELANLNQSLRARDHKYAVDVKEQENLHLLHDDKTKFERHAAADWQRHELDLDANRRDYRRYQHQQQRETVGTDPRSVLAYALEAGDITAEQFAERILQLHRAELDAANDKELRAREDAREQRDWERELERERRGWDRNEGLRAWEAVRADQAEAWQYRNHKLRADREERKQLRQWEREDQAADRVHEQHRLEHNIEIIRELAQRGHLDTVNLNVEQVVNRMLEDRGQLDNVTPPANELEPAPGRPGVEDLKKDIEMREEDAH